MTDTYSLMKKIKLGISLGFIIGVIFGLLALVSWWVSPKVFLQVGTTGWHVAPFYVLCCTIGGAIMGLLFPIGRRNPFLAWAVGFLAGIPLFIGVAFLVGLQSSVMIMVGIGLSAVFGGMTGVSCFEPEQGW